MPGPKTAFDAYLAGVKYPSFAEFARLHGVFYDVELARDDLFDPTGG